LDALLVRPSCRTFDAAEAALPEVCFFGAFRWLKALPPAVFDFEPVVFDRIVLEALLAAALPVTFLFFAIILSPAVLCRVHLPLQQFFKAIFMPK
jgi:hypothetical protein